MISLHCSTEFQTKILNTPPLCGGDFLFIKVPPQKKYAPSYGRNSFARGPNTGKPL
jgi:hypothetical protein